MDPFAVVVVVAGSRSPGWVRKTRRKPLFVAVCQRELGALGVLVVHHQIKAGGRHRRQQEPGVFPGAPSVPVLAAGSGSRARH